MRTPSARWIVAGATLLAGLAASSVARASLVESPDYEVTAEFDGFELRAYGPTIEARAPLATFTELNRGFRIVGGYIFGSNQNEAGESEKIAMTAPVGFSADDDGGWISFTMPADYDMDDLPAPTDGRVELVEVPARTLAALRFSGNARDGDVEARIEDLGAQMEAAGLEAAGEPIVAQYNPPWIPGFLRRNEILVPVRDR